MLLAILFSNLVHAQKLNDWCDVKVSSKIIATLPGVCDQERIKLMYGKSAAGVPNLTKDAEERARFAEEAQKELERKARKERLKTECASASGLLKDLCDHALDGQ